jgi:hypothetical protein
MFRPALTRMWARCAAAVDDLLAADFDLGQSPYDDPHGPAGVLAGPLAYHREHPHRVPLHSARERRPGRVPGAPAHCVSPVRPADPRRHSGLFG